jgi:RNA polymerase sigma factor (sigma-70 family)
MSESSSFRTAWMHDRLDRWKGGDLQARDQILQGIIGRLEALARRMLRGFPLAADNVETGDVLQSAALRLLRALETVRPESVRELFSLAAIQIRRELLDLTRYYRRRPFVRLPHGDDPDAPTADVPEPSRNADVSGLEDWWRFHQEVEALPAEEREVVGLLFYHRWTQVEAAQMFGVTERTVRRWWNSALLRLKAKLRDDATRD